MMASISHLPQPSPKDVDWMNAPMTWIRTLAPLLALAVAVLATPAEAGIDLSDNLSNANYSTEAATGSTWLTSSFGTDSSSYTLDSVTLLLKVAVAGQAEVAIYSDGGLQPGSLVGTLTSPTVYSTTLADTTFTAGGITLDANSTYWVVLVAAVGEFDWGWTTDNTGSGVGFQDSYGESDDAGNTWFTYTTDPTQMSVTALAVPEPSSMVLLAAGLSSTFVYRFSRKKKLRRAADLD